MNLRPRTLLSVGATLACLLVGVYATSSQILLRNAEKLEADQTRHYLDQASDELGFQIQEMHTNSAYWSNRDGAYRFMRDKQRGLPDLNLPSESSSNVDLDLVELLDANGQVYYVHPFIRSGLRHPTLAEDIRAALGFNRPAKLRPPPNAHFSGIVALSGGNAAMVSVRPIVRSSGAGPPEGWMITALVLDELETGRLSQRTHLAIDLLDLSRETLPSDCAAALAGLDDGRTSLVKPLNDKTVAGYSLVRDVFGTPVKMLRIRVPRAIYAEAIAGRRSLLGAIVATGIIFALVILWVVEAGALSRVLKLRRQVDQIDLDDGASRVFLSGRDELSWLARRIDDFVGRLRAGRLELRLANDSLEQAILRLAETNHRLANAVEGIAEVDDQGRIVDANSSFAAMHGYPGRNLVGVHWENLIAYEDHDVIGDAITGMIESGKMRCEVRGKRRDGALFHEEVVIVQAYDPEGRVTASHWFTRDISERKELETQIKHQAYHDTLTGLPNRALFVDSLRSACKRARRRSDALAVLFLDLDDFKSINDSMGHEAGDRLLAGVAERIQACVRPQDTVARLGGDEFTVLLDRISTVEEAIEVAQRILRSLQSPIVLPSGKAFAGTSIGIAFSRNGEHDAETLLHDADMAMYHSKDPSQPRLTVFAPEMQAPADERRELAEALRAGIEADQLTLVFQPIVNVSTGRPTGFEAFLRWFEPERGNVPPEMIIAVAEEAGLMNSIGRWCLRRACAEMKELIQAVPEFGALSMSVNMSENQLLHPEVIDDIQAALGAAGLAPSNLRIEVSARSLAADSDKSIERLRRISDIGVMLAIDDFGTGSHLISKLSDYPIDMVKMDGSVIWMLDSMGEARAIAQAMLIMAKSAKVRVVAESVENIAQLRQLRELECVEAQGLYFSGPVSAEELLASFSNEGGTGNAIDKRAA